MNFFNFFKYKIRVRGFVGPPVLSLVPFASGRVTGGAACLAGLAEMNSPTHPWHSWEGRWRWADSEMSKPVFPAHKKSETLKANSQNICDKALSVQTALHFQPQPPAQVLRASTAPCPSGNWRVVDSEVLNHFFLPPRPNPHFSGHFRLVTT